MKLLPWQQTRVLKLAYFEGLCAGPIAAKIGVAPREFQAAPQVLEARLFAAEMWARLYGGESVAQRPLL